MGWAFITAVFVLCIIAGIWIGAQCKAPEDEQQPD
jgi:hypothetical protein